MLIDADDWHCRRQNPRYLPSGDYRTAPTQTFTDRGYTGHLHDDGLGLVYMNARYFIPSIGRFASADTIVPQPGNPQDFNRYSYVQNNPIKFFDPSGWCSGDPSDPNNPDADCWTLLHRLEQQYHISLTGDWLFKELLSVLLALTDIEAGLDGIDHFAGIFGGTTLHRAQGILNGPDGVTARAIWGITFYDSAFSGGAAAAHWLVIHEFGHIWDAQYLLGTSRELEQVTGGTSSGCLIELLGGCTYSPGGNTISRYSQVSRREDWADAFAAYIYRGSWSAAVAQSSHDIDPDALVVATDRLTFVADQIAEYQAAYANVQLYLYGDPAFDAYILSSYVDP